MALANKERQMSATAETITQTNTFNAPVSTVFKVIASSSEHSAMTGAPAELSDEPGGSFTTHGGAIEGRLIESLADERIVQVWRPADWPAGVYSLVRYDFAANGESTDITLTHSAIPEGAAPHLAEGWNTMYWGPLAAHLDG
jgi:activator of HSP90 ATPase